jgi:hypothetical protein
VNVSIRVYDISDADIGFGIRVSSVGIGRRNKHVTFNICVGSLNASPHELDLEHLLTIIGFFFVCFGSIISIQIDSISSILISCKRLKVKSLHN